MRQLKETYTCCKQCAYHSSVEFDDVGWGRDDEYCDKKKRIMHYHKDFGNKDGSNALDETNSFPVWCPLPRVVKTMKRSK